jgi:hypothetical protein
MMVRQNQVLALAVAAALTFPVGRAVSQVSASTPPGKVFTKSKLFCLPVALEDKERAGLKEVQLFVRNGPDGPWTLKESAPPSRSEFEYRVSEDGEYAFAIAVVEKNGRSNPVDTSRLTPGIIVVVDTQPPQVTLCELPAGMQGALVQCKVEDANPDPSRLTVEYQVNDHMWKPLEPTPEDASVFRVPSPMAAGSVVRATATDRAGNSTTRVLNLEEPPEPAHLMLDPPPAVNLADSRSDKVTLPPEATAPGPGRELVAGTHLSLEYQIEKQGPSGIGKVEVWITRDEGLTWQRLCEDPSHHGPIDFDLPGEGVYGITLVVANGSGIGGSPPAKGDVPDHWVEVDMTKPVAQLLDIRPGIAEQEGTLLINWSASDKNLGATPIDLYYAMKRDGPWLPVMKGMKNDGSYRWALPRDTPGHEFFIRMDVTDRAGNLTRCETPQAVVVDLIKPKARVVSVKSSTVAHRGTEDAGARGDGK